MSGELLIVGAGPAGVSAALWARTFGIAVRVVERADTPGGQLHPVRFHPRELPGVARLTGPEIAAVYAAQLAEMGGAFEREVEAVGLEARDRAIAVITRGGARRDARAVLIATGLRRRRLGVPGEDALADRGVSYSARLVRERLRGEPVVVVGGGDGAYENALLLTEVGCDVTLLVRARPRARGEFRDRVAADPGIRVLEGARVQELIGDASLETVRIAHGGRSLDLPARGIVIKIGMCPNAEWCRALERDRDGYVVVDARGRASLPAVWAAGDVARPRHPSIAAAVGSAAMAMADIREHLRGS